MNDIKWNICFILIKKLDELSRNPNAMKLFEIDWEMLSENSNAISLLEKNPEKINWDNLSQNPNAIHLLKKYPEKIKIFIGIVYDAIQMRFLY